MTLRRSLALATLVLGFGVGPVLAQPGGPGQGPGREVQQQRGGPGGGDRGFDQRQDRGRPGQGNHAAPGRGGAGNPGPGAQGPGGPGRNYVGGPDHRFARGDRLPREYRSHQYVVDNWRGYNLAPPPRGFNWVQIGADYALIAITTGIISQIVFGH